MMNSIVICLFVFNLGSLLAVKRIVPKEAELRKMQLISKLEFFDFKGQGCSNHEGKSWETQHRFVNR